jgi:hypothetical protein
VIQAFVHIAFGGLHPYIRSFVGFTLMLSKIRNSVETYCEMWVTKTLEDVFPVVRTALLISFLIDRSL